MKIFALYNIKGGVGKTTSCVNLAYLSAQEGKRTLIWDLDPQGSASYYLCIDPKIRGGLEHLLDGKQNLNSMLRMTGYPNMDLLPADFSYRHMDQHLEERKRPQQVLEKLIRPLADRYDHLFLDCPPNLNLVAESIFQMTDVLLVPLIPTTLSLRAYNRLIQFLLKDRPKKLKVIPFFNQADLTKPIHRAVTKNVRERHPIFLQNLIPASHIIEAMGVKRSTVFGYARQSHEADSYRNLWREINERLSHS